MSPTETLALLLGESGAELTFRHRDIHPVFSDLCARIAELEARIAELEKDKRRLDRLEEAGFTTHDEPGRKGGVQCWRYETGDLWTWTARYIWSEFKTARQAIDAWMEIEK